MAPKQDTATTFPRQLLAGGVAGISEILIMYPLDVVKTRLQLQRNSSASLAYTGTIDCFRKIAAQEGLGRFYRGILAPILMETPKRATKFAANDAWGKIYSGALNMTSQDPRFAILTGASAGATESIIVTPFELVKIRLQDRSSAGRYNGIVHCTAKVIRESGPLGLYQGFESTVWRHIVWNAGYFGCIFQVRSMLPTAYTKKGTMLNDLVAGSVGGTVGTLLNTPFDVVKSRIQSTPQVQGQAVKIPWVWGGIASIYTQEGVSALYKGLVPKVLRFAPGGGIMLMVYSFVIDLLKAAN